MFVGFEQQVGPKHRPPKVPLVVKGFRLYSVCGNVQCDFIFFHLVAVQFPMRRVWMHYVFCKHPAISNQSHSISLRAFSASHSSSLSRGGHTSHVKERARWSVWCGENRLSTAPKKCKHPKLQTHTNRDTNPGQHTSTFHSSGGEKKGQPTTVGYADMVRCCVTLNQWVWKSPAGPQHDDTADTVHRTCCT